MHLEKDMNKIAIVIPTIRPELMTPFIDAWKDLFRKHEVDLILVIDGNEPKIEYIPYGLKRSVKYGVEDNPTITPPEGCVTNHYTGVVNLGYAYVYKYLLDVEYIMTFHDDETPIGDPIQDHINALNMRVPISWFSPSSVYMRGFPYEVREEAPVMFSHGVWNGVPDYDAPTQLLTPKDYQPTFFKGAIPKGALFPLCGMNLAFRREALPYVYFAPVSEYKGAERFDDIWGGIEIKKDFDRLNWAIVTGYSYVQHNRASNVYSNLIKEAVGIGKNEEYWKCIYDSWYNGFLEKRELWKKYLKES